MCQWNSIYLYYIDITIYIYMYINMNTGIIEETRDVNNCLGGLWWVGGDALVTGFEHMDTLYPV